MRTNSANPEGGRPKARLCEALGRLFLFLGISALGITGFLSLSGTDALAEPGQHEGRDFLVVIEWKEASELNTIENEGALLRYCEPGAAVFQMSGTGLEALRSGRGHVSVIGPVSEKERSWLVVPSNDASRDSLGKYGKVAPVNNRGLFIVSVSEILEAQIARHVFFMTLLPDSMDWRPLFRKGPPSLLRSRMNVRSLTGLGGPAFLNSVASSVNEDSIRATIHFLSYDDDLHKYRSRFALLPDTVLLRSFFPEWLREKLQVSMGSRGTASLDSFQFRYGGTDFTLYNTVGRIPGRYPGSGTLILCAHYDSQAGNTVYPDPDRTWVWLTDPAPGADDNGSGVASVLECARVLSGLEFDFDLEFVLFGAEEQGLIGSKAFAQSRKAVGENILGAVNFDMHAFRPEADSTFLRTNPSSDWLSSHISGISEALFDSVGLRVGLVPVAGPVDASDHAAFWMSGFDGVHFFEQSGFPVINPYYHTIYDTSGTVNFPLALKVAKVGAASIAYFSTTTKPWDLEVLTGDLQVRRQGRVEPLSEGSVGEIVSVVPSFHNIGLRVPDSISVRVSAYDGPPSDGALIGERLIAVSDTPIGSGEGPVIEPFSWFLSETEVGAHDVNLVIDAGQSEENKANNVASTTFFVAGATFDVHSYVYPDPSKGGLAELTLRVFVTRDAILDALDIYDVSGRRVGGCKGDACGLTELRPGGNAMPLGEILSDSGIAPGVYLYRLAVRDGTTKKVLYGRFAVLE